MGEELGDAVVAAARLLGLELGTQKEQAAAQTVVALIEAVDRAARLALEPDCEPLFYPAAVERGRPGRAKP